MLLLIIFQFAYQLKIKSNLIIILLYLFESSEIIYKFEL